MIFPPAVPVREKLGAGVKTTDSVVLDSLNTSKVGLIGAWRRVALSSFEPNQSKIGLVGGALKIALNADKTNRRKVELVEHSSIWGCPNCPQN